MLREHAGCIVNVSSMWGLRGASCEVTYSATKAALIALTRSLAAELAPTHIRVNCVAPGVIKTDMLDALPSEVLPQLAVEAEIVTARAEEHVASCRETYDIATSRAVARLNVLAELCLPYVRVGGVFLAMKGALAQEEVDEARRGVEKLGGRVASIYEYPVADAVHKAVVIEKVCPTPPQYPRAFAKIKKAPL